MTPTRAVSRPLARRLTLGAAGALAAVAVAACGTSTAADGTAAAPATLSTGSPSPSPTDAAASPSPSDSTSAAPSEAPTTSDVPTAAPQAGQLPDVVGATDLKKAPSLKAATAAAPSAVVTKDLVVGTGKVAAASSTVTVQYYGANYADGKAFNSTWKDNNGQPTPFALSEVIPGFAKGIEGMKVGGRREIVIPSAYGYGAQGSSPAVAPNENLVFIVDLYAVQ